MSLFSRGIGALQATRTGSAALKGATAAGRLGVQSAATGMTLGAGVKNGIGTLGRVNPFITIPAFAALGAAATFGSPQQQGTPTGPARAAQRPGYDSMDMGAQGDLVFALHHLNH